MSAPSAELLQTGLAKIDQDLRFLMDCLREVLAELGEPLLAEYVPWTDHGNPADGRDGKALPTRLGQVAARPGDGGRTRRRTGALGSQPAGALRRRAAT